MKIEIEIDDSLYECFRKFCPEDIDINILFGKLIEGTISDFATHQEEAIRSSRGEATEEDRRLLEDLSRRRVQRVFDTARKQRYECADCHQQFLIPQGAFGKVACPGCGREWAKEELPKLIIDR